MSELDRVNLARANGTKRKMFVQTVEKVLEEYAQGRGATTCMADIIQAHKMLKGIR